MSDTYERIAPFYDVDMARNMRFDDIGLYASICAGHAGPVLELGCGTGRILLDLLSRGIDVVGMDASAAMLAELQRKSVAGGTTARVARMDLRNLAFAQAFSVVLCPYSLVTYLTAHGELARLLVAVDRILMPGGAIVLDAFVPKPVVAAGDFTLDYERPFADGFLARWKRITPLGVTNRIERRYVVLAADRTPVQSIEVAEEIRPYSPAALLEALAQGGYDVLQTFRDYGLRHDTYDAQFFTVVATPSRTARRDGTGGA